MPQAGEYRTDAPSPASGAADDACSRYVLVVEDETLIALSFTAMLEYAGFEVIGPVGDLKSAMALLDERDVSLAILDINLAGGETSAPIAECLMRRGTPFVVTSGNAGDNGPGIFGGARNLPKPVGARALVAAVQEALA